jgi:hypothetical protein
MSQVRNQLGSLYMGLGEPQRLSPFKPPAFRLSGRGVF